MNPVNQMSNEKRAKVALAIGTACLAMCALAATVPVLRVIAFEALMHVSGMVIGFSVMSVGFAITTLAKDSSVPVWLRILGGASLIPAWAVFVLVLGLVGGWILLALPLLFFVAWFAGGRPTWKQINRG